MFCELQVHRNIIYNVINNNRFYEQSVNNQNLLLKLYKKNATDGLSMMIHKICQFQAN